MKQLFLTLTLSFSFTTAFGADESKLISMAMLKSFPKVTVLWKEVRKQQVAFAYEGPLSKTARETLGRSFPPGSDPVYIGSSSTYGTIVWVSQSEEDESLLNFGESKNVRAVQDPATEDIYIHGEGRVIEKRGKRGRGDYERTHGLLCIPKEGCITLIKALVTQPFDFNKHVETVHYIDLSQIDHGTDAATIKPAEIIIKQEEGVN